MAVAAVAAAAVVVVDTEVPVDFVAAAAEAVHFPA